MKKLIAMVVTALAMMGCGNLTGPTAGDDDGTVKAKKVLEGAAGAKASTKLAGN